MTNYMVTVVPSPLGSGHAVGSYVNVTWQDRGMPIPEGASVSFLANPNGGYVFDHWDFTCGFYHGTYTTPIFSYYITAETVATAYFRSVASPPPPPALSNVTFGVEGQGTVAATSPPPYHVGDSLYVQATPSAGWDFRGFKRNGVEWTNNNPGEFLNLQASESIVAVFVQTANGGGGDGDGKGAPSVNVVAVVGAMAVLAGVGCGLYRWLKGKKKQRR